MTLPAATKAAGMCFAFPDVCLTPAPPAPPVPVPYPNTAMLPQATNVVMNVLIENKECFVQGSVIPMSRGDEPGVNGGVVSGINMGPVMPRQFSSKVFFGGRKAVYHTCMTGHNGVSSNQPMGTHTVPSQMKVIVAM